MRNIIIRERSGPIYIETPEQTISLVEETALRAWHFGPIRLIYLRPNAVFVIKSDGVQALSLSRRMLPRLALVLLALLGAPAQYLLFKKRHTHER